VFSLQSIREAVNKAVQEACKYDEEKRKQMLRQMQLRWHPGASLCQELLLCQELEPLLTQPVLLSSRLLESTCQKLHIYLADSFFPMICR
jgi:hypothetical protein